MIASARVNWRDSAGVWQPIDTRLVEQRDGSFRNASGPESVTFAAAIGAGEVLRIDGEGWSMGFALEGAAAGQAARVEGSKVTYPEVFPGVDLEYELATDSVKEVFVVKDRQGLAAMTRARFRMRMAGAELKDDDGLMIMVGDGRRVARLPDGEMDDAAGGRSGVAVEAIEDAAGRAIDVVPDARWLQSRRSFPVRIDPSVILGDGTSYDAYASSGSPTTNFNGAAQLEGSQYVDKVGFETSGGPETYSYQYFDLTPVKGKQILTATWESKALDVRGTGQFTMWAVADPWTADSVTWNTLPRHRTDAAARKDPSVALSQTTSVDVKDWLERWLDPNGWPNYGFALNTAGADRYVEFAAMDGTGYRPQITVTYNPGPSVSFPEFPGSPVTTATPTLTSGVVSGMQYAYRIGTGVDADSGVVATSTLQASPSWTVPAGVLRNGVTYHWKAYTYNGSAWASSSPRELTLNQQLGASTESPLDTVGPMTVNLATGNLFYGHSSPTFQTVGGPLGLSFSYNSQAQPSYGLTGNYYANCDGTQPWELGRPTTRRHDTGNGSTWTLSWAGAPIPGSVESDAFCVRWKGYLTVPYDANNWSFGATYQDAVRIYLNDEPVPYFDGPSGQVGDPLDLDANETIPITIDFVDTAGTASVELRSLGPASGAVPVTWLSPTPPVLPTGWNTSVVASTTLSYVSAVIDPGDPNLIALVGPAGEVSSFVVDPATKAIRPVGLDRSIVAKAEDGTLVVNGMDGIIYSFDTKGKLTSATSALDRTNPAAAQYGYDNTTGKVSYIKDPVSNRQINLLYSTDPFAGGTQCPTKAGFGFDSNAPVGHLCKISYWDSTATNLFYRGGRLAAIEDPGDANATASDAAELTLFHYDGSGRLSMVRDPLAADKVAEGIYGDDPITAANQNIRTLVGYNAQNRVSFVTLPQPAPGVAAKPSHSYDNVGAWETQVDVAGLTQPLGFARKVTFSEAGRVETDTDATNRTTTTEWEGENLIYTDDPAGLRTSRIYDVDNGHSERVIKVNGPAPMSCFSYDVMGCYTTATSTSTDYDTVGGAPLTGLAATYWANAEFSGPPGGEERYTGTGGGFTHNWGSGQPAAMTPTSDQWSARFTGEFLIGIPALVTFRIGGDDGVRLFVDDRMVAEKWSCCTLPPAEVTLNLTEDRHRIRVDYRDTGGGASLDVSWKIAPSSTFVALPMSMTYPAYGLVTQVTDGEGKVTRTEYAAPERGLPTATVVDPAGLNLRTEVDYSDSLFRRTARRLPKHAGGGPATTYAYYGAGANPVTVDDPCTVPVDSVHQGGALWKTTDTATVAVLREFVYNARGQVVASRFGTGPWECTTYDQRGRVLTSKDTAGKTTSSDYTTAGTVKVTHDTAVPTVFTTAEVDLVGRPIVYRDEHGTVSKTVYDQPGRMVETRRAYPGQTERLLTGHEYDAAGRPTAMIDYNDRLLDTEPGQARRTEYTYDTAGRPDLTTAPNTIVSKQTYDNDHGGAVSTLSVKRAGVELSPWSYAYNRAGKVTSETTTIGGASRVRSFTYDSAWRLTPHRGGRHQPLLPLRQELEPLLNLVDDHGLLGCGLRV
ncbi:MAG: DNRLRE domain-containing protein [Acidimicrobiia bacterium]